MPFVSALAEHFKRQPRPGGSIKKKIRFFFKRLGVGPQMQVFWAWGASLGGAGGGGDRAGGSHEDNLHHGAK